jgi:hypothetical protein
MQESEFNPPENAIPTGIKEEELVRCITSSGFPLQGTVAHSIRDKYQLTEEWSYIDRDTGELRSLDIFAYKSLGEIGMFRPRIIILIECKSSIHPYVFFQNAVQTSMQFPSICGARMVEIRSTAQPSSHSQVPLSRALGLADTAFAKAPAICSAFTQAIANGKKVTVSGTDPFNSIVMPLVKSNDHAKLTYGRIPDHKTEFPTLVLNVCVVDAPMVLVGNPDNGQSVQLQPWARVLRSEAKADDFRRTYYVDYIVDVVHRGYLSQFFDQHVAKFSETFCDRLGEKESVVTNGGVVADLNSWGWQDTSSSKPWKYNGDAPK